MIRLVTWNILLLWQDHWLVHYLQGKGSFRLWSDFRLFKSACLKNSNSYFFHVKKFCSLIYFSSAGDIVLKSSVKSKSKSKLECALFNRPVIDHWLATYIMRSDRLIRHDSFGSLVNCWYGIQHFHCLPHFRYSVIGSLLRFTHVSKEQANGTMEETMLPRLVPNGRPK